MLPKNIYEHPEFYELKMMIDRQRINRSFAYSGKGDNDKALAQAIAFKEATLKSFELSGVALNRNPAKAKFTELVDLYEREMNRPRFTRRSPAFRNAVSQIRWEAGDHSNCDAVSGCKTSRSNRIHPTWLRHGQYISCA
jgi:hypothetical protein